MVDTVFILVPSAVTDSPVKGAAALANTLIDEVNVYFVALKPGEGSFNILDDRIKVVRLWKSGGWIKRLLCLRDVIKTEGENKTVATISIGLSADFFNICCRDIAITCSSVRGNLPEVYPESYGASGKYLAIIHLKMLRYLNHVVSMTQFMSDQVQQYINRPSPIIGNFVDETRLEKFKSNKKLEGPFRFIFTGSLINGKEPYVLLTAFKILQESGVKAQLDFFGDGQFMFELKRQSEKLPNSNAVTFHGFSNEPYQAISEADVLILPSKTEGVSRSVLEALFLGTPCILREVDGNAELVQAGINGNLFQDNKALAKIMLETAEWSRKNKPYEHCLLPERYRQKTASQQFLALLNGYDSLLSSAQSDV